MTQKNLLQLKKIARAIIFLNDPGHYYSRINMLKRKGLIIGDNVQILHGTVLDESKPFLIKIGSNVTFAPRCHVLTHDASMNIFQKKTRIAKVKIKDNCFIGAGTLILPGVNVGPNSLVGAGSLISNDVPENSVVAGKPARLLCSTEVCLNKHAKLSESHPNYPYPECHGNWISKENALKMAKELDGTFSYSVGSMRDS